VDLQGGQCVDLRGGSVWIYEGYRVDLGAEMSVFKGESLWMYQEGSVWIYEGAVC
jgi:hypothetical protein